MMNTETKLKKDIILNEEKPTVYLFVCTGNTCRSPMAEAVANFLLKDRGIVAQSAGLSVPYPEPIAQNAVIALEEMGIEPTEYKDFHAHTARPLTAELMERADKVFGLTDGHNFAILTAFPEYADKISPLGVSVPDPYGGSLGDYIKALSSITEAIKQL